MIIGTIVQQPNEMLDYQVDFEEFFAGEDDYITSAEVFISPLPNQVVTGVSSTTGFYDKFTTAVTTVPFIPPKEDIVVPNDGGYGEIIIEANSQPRNVKFFLLGGDDGDKFKITVRIKTRLRRIKEEEIKVKIKEI